MPTLTTYNAEIRTATVEIKTLTVSGKQVTLAVFRQLPERPLIAEDGTLNGVPWGWVNYHPDPKMCPESEHRHVVWQAGAELRRAAVTSEPQKPSPFRPKSGPDYLDAYVRDLITGSGGSLPPASSEGEVVVAIDGVNVGMQLGERARSVLGTWGVYQSALNELAAGGAESRHQFHMEGIRWWLPEHRISTSAAVRAYRHLLAADAAALGTQSVADAHMRVAAEAGTEVGRRRRAVAVRQTLAELPQLFIAV